MKNLILPFLLSLTFVFSCTNSDDNETLEKNIQSYDVYVGGVDEFHACYWKNNQKTLLSGGENLQGTSITVDQGNIYMLANNIQKLGGNHVIPAWYFWKNGSRYNLAEYLNVAPNNMNEHDNLQIWNNMTVENGNVYFFGVIKNPSTTSTSDQYQICYWKNGVKTVLENTDYYGSFTGCLSVYNNDVYAVTRRNISPSGGIFNWETVLYKNTVYASLSNNTFPKYFLKDNSGISIFTLSSNGTPSVKNIINNTELTIPASITPSEIKDIVLDNSDRYFIGSTFYYKNDVLNQISDSNNFTSIGHFVSKDQNIYMTRYNTAVGGKAVKFYVNNTEMLSLPDVSRGCFNSIFVAPN
ncbi:hypothetical protein [Chryseobacterium sp. Leaf394]|uniref:hypothetical protein n=1 Tax=Chryseobacterium sp. Leaf394 TaxID=1736361 RepID=UPI0006F9E666|nr:hypothetical protein [Chryseobacterium sp. Leaf394]KQS92961.1 hypothetical protein ASG21_11145 [Chryseobacterium sp. Leaf394]